jgi:hypothetical protein
MTQNKRLLPTLLSICRNASDLHTLCLATVGNYLMTLDSREIRFAHSRSLKVHMTTLLIQTYGQKILQEAQITFFRMSGCKIATFITTKDFQEYWQRVDERTSSSFSGATFLHYKAASFHYMLSAMHAAYLTACTRRGIPLARWGIGLTVLLEKVIGNNFCT